MYQNKICKRVNQVVQKLLAANTTSKTAWTRAIKESLLQVGADSHLHTYTSLDRGKSKPAWGEWLWDLTWAEQRLPRYGNTGTHMITRIRLAAEIEWDTGWDSILVDFQKLVFAVSDLKLYIFTKGNPEANSQIVEYCRELAEVNAPHETGRYLLIGIPRSLDHGMKLFIEPNLFP